MSLELKKPNLIESIVLGGASCIFTVNFTHPIETVKTRMQVTGNGLGTVVSSLVKTEGVTAFWKGIAFAWGREGSYASIKLGAYGPVRDALGAGKDAPFYMKFLAGAITGGTGSVIGNPFDVMKTLAQANKEKSAPLMTLVGNMYRDQGVAGFYRGVGANVARACVLNATKMACYDIAKGYVVDATGWGRKDPRTVFASGMVAGICMTVTVSPFDRIRTSLMNQPTDKKLYTGFVDCFVKTIQADGPTSLWRGFIPIWARFAPTATIQLLTLETLYSYFGYASL
ncbi:Kidney mitochondrial carrier protein 1 [Seminavis robusta]|uniref:Kidney mitochondrial carrier protein 1 n=1 Tax=Seminavis robusta TaxID=568900 RepID=A0A9N8DYS9_9STRA|nr:Kidney mitochondrial carrier protein 1 [Seminavis robusta]|eukprot:Sro479_g151130.1 Kidney mitochondrial carrier protein 1 (284) ;mRNA; f:8925-10246